MGECLLWPSFQFCNLDGLAPVCGSELLLDCCSFRGLGKSTHFCFRHREDASVEFYFNNCVFGIAKLIFPHNYKRK